MENLKGEVLDILLDLVEVQLQIGNWPESPLYERRTFDKSLFKDKLNIGDFIDLTIIKEPGKLTYILEKSEIDFSEIFEQKDFFDKYGDDLLPE